MTTMIFGYIRNMSAGKAKRKPDVREGQASPSQSTALEMRRESAMAGEK